jgi:hypothetical protein
MGGSAFIGGVVPMGKTLAPPCVLGCLATSGTTNLFIFKMVFTQRELQLCASVHTRNEYKEKVVPLFHLYQRGCHMREKTIERKLVQAVKAMGGSCPKFVSPGFDGMPDRLVLLPMGRIAFVEVKAMGSKPRPLREARHGMLRRLGFEIYVLDDGARIQEILKEMGGDAK